METPKKRINSKNKGSGFERDIAKLLSETLAPLKFRRTPQSGAIVGGNNFATTGNLFNQQGLTLFVGDVSPCNDGEDGNHFRFVVETKFYKDQDTLEHLLTGKAKVFGWLDEVDVDKVKVGKEGIVIMKFNGKKPMFAVRANVCVPTIETMVVGDAKIGFLSELLKVPEWWVDKR